MLSGPTGGFPVRLAAYGRTMDMHDVAPRTATINRSGIRREGRPATTHRFAVVAAVAGAALAIAIAACSPAASSAPGGSLALPSLPSVDVSAGASLATGAANVALDQVDVAIAANQSSGALTADDASDLQELTAGIRTALTSGDTTAARSAVEDLAAKVDEDEISAKLNTDVGAQLKAAIEALKAALPAS